MSGADMSNVIRLVQESERERTRLIREARAIYDSIFAPADPAGERQDKAAVSRGGGGENSHATDGVGVP
jgi:hypothetical protein